MVSDVTGGTGRRRLVGWGEMGSKGGGVSVYVMYTNSTAGAEGGMGRVEGALQRVDWTHIDRFEGAGIEIDPRTVGRRQALDINAPAQSIDRSID